VIVYHHWSVEWHPRDDPPPHGLPRVVCVARRAVSDPFSGPGPFPGDIDRALCYWNRIASGGARDHAGYEVVWRVAVVADDADGDAPDSAWSDAPVYRARRRLLRWIMRRQCPLFADHFAAEHFRSCPAYFGLEPGA